MHMPVPLFAPNEEPDIDVWLCADELPWMAEWDESTAAFESMEPLAIMERMPSQQEFLEHETHSENQPELTADFDLISTEEN